MGGKDRDMMMMMMMMMMMTWEEMMMMMMMMMKNLPYCRHDDILCDGGHLHAHPGDIPCQQPDPPLLAPSLPKH